MHTYLKDTTGWNMEFLRDDSDLAAKSSKIKTVQQAHEGPSLEEKLEGCSFILLRRQEGHYVVEIEFRERFRDTSMLVEAKVIDKRHAQEGEDGLHNLEYYQRKRFVGEGSKAKAASYAEDLKKVIETTYLGLHLPGAQAVL